MYRERLSIAGTEPVSLAEAKEHARIEIDTEDTMIARLISGSRKWAETWTKRRYIQHEFKVTYDSSEICNPLKLEQGSKIASVSEIKTFDNDDAETTHPAADYRISNNRIILLDGINDAVKREFDAMTVTYTTVQEGVDLDAVKEAILLIVTHWYENREEASIDTVLKNIPAGAKAALADQKVWTF